MFSSLRKSTPDQAPWFVANFDSSSGLVKALANSLHGKGFEGVGEVPNSEILARLINALPWHIQRYVYVKGGSMEAVDPDRTGEIQAHEFSEWVTGLYPKRKYPVILLGSSSGSAVHLGAAMGIPWLPQTFLIPVRTPDSLSVDEPIRRMEWARKPAEMLLTHNPDLQLHHMMDPNQDRPMLQGISYFRVKQRRLGAAYEQFIQQHLADGGTLLVVECQKSWPTTQVDERHNFQFGGLGGTTPEEYLHGSDRVAEFLKKQGSTFRKWEAPQPDGASPEAEWGFAPALGKDIERFAQINGYKVQRLAFEEPEDLSPFVADLYRWWYRQRGTEANQLLADMFFLMEEPYWTLQTGTVPFWLAFNAAQSARFFRQYLLQTEPYDNLYLIPFSHGMEGMGLAQKEDWQEALALAKDKGEFLGADPNLYPFDFGVYARYQKEIKEKIPSRHPIDEKLTLRQLLEFEQRTKGKYRIDLLAPILSPKDPLRSE